MSSLGALVACSSAPTPESASREDSELQTTPGGAPTGDGRRCWWSESDARPPATDPSTGHGNAAIYRVGEAIPRPTCPAVPCTCAADGIRCPAPRCPDPGVCTFQGKTYEIGDVFQNDCNSCSCGPGGAIACTTRACADSGPPGVCTHKGKTYGAGESFPDDCNTCVCRADGAVGCTTRGCSDAGDDGACTWKGKSYRAGESFMDDCNTCVCRADGAVGCTTRGCL